MAKDQSMNYLDYTLTDYVIPQQQQQQRQPSLNVDFKAELSLMYPQQQQQQPQQQSDQIPNYANILLPQSPDTFQCDDNNSYCTSPSSILSTASNHLQQQFPSPSPSPYQHASESNASLTNVVAMDTVSMDTNNFYHSFLPFNTPVESSCTNVDDFIMTHTSYNGNNNSNNNDNSSKKRKFDKVEKDDKLNNSEIKRQIHIQSEQKRRAQIKDGFEDLRNELPSCLNKKMSKVALLHRTVQHIQHLKNTQMTILAELERLVGENDQLRKFQENVLQKQQQSMFSTSSS
ncbi:Calcineurin subunit B [Mucor velutinosus]|uniref:Calcineurin subunit B n=1 Tax=Mucor velutinosus TaxID=708070 RepID=A0AAN7DK24_9FUNG|nr:Calcineurin subunit B [Mucor velutinosus]